MFKNLDSIQYCNSWLMFLKKKSNSIQKITDSLKVINSIKTFSNTWPSYMFLPIVEHYIQDSEWW